MTHGFLVSFPGALFLGLLASLTACASSRPDALEPPSKAEGEAPEDEATGPGTDRAPEEEASTQLAEGQRRALPSAPAEGEGKACGGFAGDTCGETEYCAYKAGQHCGAADASAICKPRPEICTKIYRPVCGCDSRTYASACTAAAAGQGVLTEGECPSSPDEPVGE